jgi:signal peptidase I
MKPSWIAIDSVLALVVLACLASVAYGLTRYGNYSAPSDSMAPTVRAGAAFIVDRFAYRGASPQRGDVVMFVPPIASANPFFKRIVAVPGDRYAIHGGHVTLNGQRTDEPYIAEATSYDLAVRDYGLWIDGAPIDRAVAVVPPRSEWSAPDTVPRGCYIMLGDNRNNSEDSHVFGFVCPGRPGNDTRSKPVAIIGRAILPPYYQPPSGSSRR